MRQDTHYSVLAAAAVGTLIFGQYSMDISIWIVCGLGDKCAPHVRMPALSLAVFLTATIGLLGVTRAWRELKMSTQQAAAAMLTVIIGVLLALLKVSTQGADVPNWQLLRQPLFFYVVYILLVVPSVLIASQSAKGGPLLIIKRISAAFCIGLLLGLVASAISELAWVGHEFNRWGGGKFIAAPYLTVIALGTWSVAMYDPWLRYQAWNEADTARHLWLVGYGLGAVVLSAGFGTMFHSEPDAVTAALVLAGLTLPGLVAVGLALAPKPHRLTFGRASAAMLGAMVVAAAIAWTVVTTSTDTQRKMLPMLPFILAHSLAAAAVVATVATTHWTLSGRPQEGPFHIGIKD